MTTTISHRLCQAMLDQGIDALYCLPGVQNDDFFNVLVDFPGLRPFVTRHEQATSYMATGAALASGRAQAYCTVPGQGVLNAAAGHSTAFATSARVLALIGQNRTDMMGRMHGMLHELPDQMRVLEQISKHAVGLTDGPGAAADITRAFKALASGNPAPVTVECPLDLWSAETGAPGDMQPEDPPVDTDAIERAADLLARSRRPMIVVGGGAHGAAEDLKVLAGMLGAPVSALRQGKGAYDDRLPLAVPGPVAHELWKTVDVVLGIGTRFQWHEMTWGVDDDMTLIQINADPAEINRRGRIDVPINALAEHALPLLIEALGRKLARREDRSDEIATLKADFARRLAGLQPQVDHLTVIRQEIGEDGIFVDDLTQVAYAARYAFPVYTPRSYVCAGYAGTLGWGIPAALGAKIAMPDRRVVSVQGDGGFMYASNELATAVKYNIPLVSIVYNDNAYGNVQRIQEDRFGHNRTIATDLHNPDIVRYVESFGAMAIRAADGAEGLRMALREAFAANGPVVIEVPVPVRYPSPWPFIFLPTVRGPKCGPLLTAT